MTNQTALQKRDSHDIQSAERTRAGRTYVPQVDILENDEKLMLVADMPGVRAEDLDVRFENGELSIHGQVKSKAEGDGVAYLRREYGVGDYYRVFQVGDRIDSTKIDAEMQNGVLMLHLPKTEASVPRRINVKSK